MFIRSIHRIVAMLTSKNIYRMYVKLLPDNQSFHGAVHLAATTFEQQEFVKNMSVRALE